MIVTLRGTFTYKGNGFAVVETTAGVGYQVYLSASTLAELPIGSQQLLWTHEFLREDSRELYGFRNERERGLFLQLIAVSGVGPKTALNLLSLGRIEEIEHKIDEGDATWLSRVPHVGKKTAQKIILELRGKLTSIEALDSTSTEVISALTNLGYARDVARDVALSCSDGSVEERLRKALKALAR